MSITLSPKDMTSFGWHPSNSIAFSIGAGRLSAPIYNLLGENIIKCAYLYSVPARGNIPALAEIIIPREEYTGNKNSGLAEVTIGSRVRILDGYYAGEIGYISVLATAGKEPFYKKLGFAARPNILLGAGMTAKIRGPKK